MTQPPYQVPPEQAHKDHIEALKTIYDFFKHLTTLSTGSILLMATLMERVFKSPVATGLVSISFVGFIVSIVSSLASMFVLTQAIKAPDFLAPAEKNFWALAVAGAVGGFLVAISLLVLFSVKNFS
jgi:hypothetical protein